MNYLRVLRLSRDHLAGLRSWQFRCLDMAVTCGDADVIWCGELAAGAFVSPPWGGKRRGGVLASSLIGAGVLGGGVAVKGGACAITQ